MTRKIITGVVAAVLVVTIAVFAAEKAKEKAFAEKAKAGEQLGRHERLLDQLAEAYNANDREKMGEIINKMQERREKMEKFVKLNRWHQWAHRRMMEQMGPGWGQGQQMAGPGWNRGWAMQGQGPNQGCSMACPQCRQFQAMRERGFAGCNNMMGNCGPMPGGPGQMPCQQGGMGMGNCMPQQGGPGQMPCQQGGMGMNNWMPQQGGPGQMPGCGRGFQQGWTPRPDAGNMGQQEWNMPRHERMNVPPPEWGW